MYPFPGLHDLFYKASILHRDVTVDNIMYEKRGDFYLFRLTNFDAAIEVADNVPLVPFSRHDHNS